MTIQVTFGTLSQSHSVERTKLLLNVSRLEMSKKELQEKADKIAAQLETASANWFARGVYADADWYRKAKCALRHTRRQAQQVQIELSVAKKALKAFDYQETQKQHSMHSERRQAEKKLYARSLETHFLDIARETLTPDVFDKILQEAKSAVASS